MVKKEIKKKVLKPSPQQYHSTVVKKLSVVQPVVQKQSTVQPVVKQPVTQPISQKPIIKPVAQPIIHPELQKQPIKQPEVQQPATQATPTNESLTLDEIRAEMNKKQTEQEKKPQVPLKQKETSATVTPEKKLSLEEIRAEINKEPTEQKEEVSPEIELLAEHKPQVKPVMENKSQEQPTESKCIECERVVAIDSRCPICHQYVCEQHLFSENHRCRVKKRLSFKPYLTVLAILVITGMIIYTLYTMPKISFLPSWSSIMAKNTTTKTNKTISVTQPVIIDYNEYLKNPDKYDGAKLKLYGTLSKMTVENGYFAYLNDDFGKQILLQFKNQDQREVFESRINQAIYLVNGIVYKNSKGLYIDVSSIAKSQRQTTIVQKTILV